MLEGPVGSGPAVCSSFRLDGSLSDSALWLKYSSAPVLRLSRSFSDLVIWSPKLECSSAPVSCSPRLACSSAPVSCSPRLECSSAPVSCSPRLECSSAPVSCSPRPECSSAPVSCSPRLECSSSSLGSALWLLDDGDK